MGAGSFFTKDVKEKGLESSFFFAPLFTAPKNNTSVNIATKGKAHLPSIPALRTGIWHFLSYYYYQLTFLDKETDSRSGWIEEILRPCVLLYTLLYLLKLQFASQVGKISSCTTGMVLERRNVGIKSLQNDWSLDRIEKHVPLLHCKWLDGLVSYCFKLNILWDGWCISWKVDTVLYPVQYVWDSLQNRYMYYTVQLQTAKLFNLLFIKQRRILPPATEWLRPEYLEHEERHWLQVRADHSHRQINLPQEQLK